MTVAVIRRAIELARPYIPIVETPGWENRSNGLALNPAGGFPMDHHLVVRLLDTADYVAFCVNMATHGHATLSGPLCNTLSTPSGVLYIIAGGAANHSGRGSSAVLARLRAGQPPGSPGPDDMTGNVWFIGDEAMHPGDNTPWPAALRRTKAIWAAAVLVAGGKKKALSLQHKEWSLRKIDCSFGSGDSQRDAVMYWIGVFLGLAPVPSAPTDTTSPTDTDWIDMASKKELQEAFEAAIAKIPATPTVSIAAPYGGPVVVSTPTPAGPSIGFYLPDGRIDYVGDSRDIQSMMKVTGQPEVVAVSNGFWNKRILEDGTAGRADRRVKS